MNGGSFMVSRNLKCTENEAEGKHLSGVNKVN